MVCTLEKNTLATLLAAIVTNCFCPCVLRDQLVCCLLSAAYRNKHEIRSVVKQRGYKGLDCVFINCMVTNLLIHRNLQRYTANSLKQKETIQSFEHLLIYSTVVYLKFYKKKLNCKLNSLFTMKNGNTAQDRSGPAQIDTLTRTVLAFNT